MVLPWMIGGIGAVAGVIGAIFVIRGVFRIREAGNTMKIVQSKLRSDVKMFGRKDYERNVLAGSVAGIAGGLVAAGLAVYLVMALGSASTGREISTLSGAASKNATLAALGGGSLASGGGGMALGVAILCVAALGAGLFIGGMIVDITSKRLVKKADEAYANAKYVEKEYNSVINGNE